MYLDNKTNEPVSLKRDARSTIQETHKPQIRLFKNQIVLNPSISIFNFIGYILYGFMIGLLPAPIDVLQQPLLGIIFKMYGGAQDTANTVLLLSSILVQSCTAPFYGYLCNKFGRKFLVLYGIILLTIDLYLTPAMPSVYPGLLLLKLLGANGLSSLQILPLLADYFEEDSRGKMSGVFFVCQGISGIVLMYAFQNGDLSEDIIPKYRIVCLINLVVGLFVFILIKGGKYYKQPTRAESQSIMAETDNNNIPLLNRDTLPQSELIPENSLPQEPGILDGIKQVKNPWILIAYLLSFLSSATYGMSSVVNIGYITSLTGDEDTASQGLVLFMLNLILVLVSSLVFGFLCDKYSKFKINLFALICAFLGSTIMIIFPDPYGLGIYFSAVLLGVGNGAMSTLGLNLVSQCPPKHAQEAVFSINFVALQMGTISTSVLGVYLLQVDLMLPFYLYSSFAVLIFMVSIVLYFTKNNVRNKVYHQY